MATWEDGPEYAPTTRPDGFSSVDAPPLEPASRVEQSAAGAPKPCPEFAAPPVALAPLETLVPELEQPRDPGQPFSVASSTVTSMDSAWGAAHWDPPSNGAAPQLGAAGQFPGGPVPVWPGSETTPWSGPSPSWPAGATAGPGTGSAPDWGTAPLTSWPAPTAPVPPVSGPASLPSGYPPHGTPQWFGPGPGLPPQPPGPVRRDARAIMAAATPGLIICLAIGGFIYLLAPITLGIAVVLSHRVKIAEEQIRRVFHIAWGLIAVLAVARFLVDGSYRWWSFVGACALIVSWFVILAVLELTHRGLQNGPPRPPSTPYSSHWG